MLLGIFAGSEKKAWLKPWNVKNLDQASGHASDESTGSWVAFTGRAWWRNGQGAVQPQQLLKFLLTDGSQALRRMDGSFAVAWLDGRKAELFLARDYFGIEPLHYSLQNDRFVFASRVPDVMSLLPN